jgi:Fe-S cluster biogenesis protein NfuA
MSGRADARAVAERVEGLLDELDGSPVAEELVRTLMEFYGAGLARIVALTPRPEVYRLAADDVVGGLLVLHDLHPLSVAERVQAALDKVRPYLGSHAGDVELLGIDDEGMAHLQLGGSCDGCPSSLVTAKVAIEGAIRNAAPELTGVEVLGVVPEPTGPGGRPLLPLQTIECPTGLLDEAVR